MTMMTSTRLLLLYASLFALGLSSCEAFAPLSSSSVPTLRSLRCQVSLSASVSSNNHNADITAATNSRRLFLSNAIATSTAALTLLKSPLSALAAEDDTSPQSSPSAKPKLKPLKDYLYNILRVREATQQETRLISTGKFKDVQRANVKLAVKFMINNYKLSDSVIAASSYLKGNDRVQASQSGQSAVQSLYTIVEYFDSSDVENIKIGDSLAGKEEIVNKGLASVRRDIDEFISYFPTDVVDEVKSQIMEENELNFKEFDPSLGSILNPNPK